MGTHPGCGLSTFRYAWNQGKPCPRYNDRCVKLIEQRGADVLVTRDCKIIYVPLCLLHYLHKYVTKFRFCASLYRSFFQALVTLKDIG